MSVGSPLSYYSAEKSVTARPWAITAVAIVGIVLAGLAILSQMFVAPPAIADPGGRMEMTAFNFGYMFGRLVFIAFLLLMLIGCCGLLSMRSAARLMMIVAAYGWIALAIISILFMVYSSYVYSGNSARTAWMVSLPALMVIAQLGFAVWAMVVVRRPELAPQFGREGNHQVASPLLKGVALVTLIYFGIAALESLVEALGVAFKMPGRDIMLAIRVLPVGNNDADVRLLDLLLATFLHAGFIVGCILVMNGRMAGTRVLIACCL
ncbi:MAG: hypothetical protein JWN40_862, partial [Phycisphaerales bacterium]|nr:hypothetical protein [Phycisphaerales bacterium]